MNCKNGSCACVSLQTCQFHVVCMWAFVLMTGPSSNEVTMILGPTLTQPNPFLTVLLDPNVLTRSGPCGGDVLPWHTYRIHRQTVAREPGLLLLGALRETQHKSESTLKRRQSMWLIVLNNRPMRWHINIYIHVSICTLNSTQEHVDMCAQTSSLCIHQTTLIIFLWLKLRFWCCPVSTLYFLP